MSTALSKTYGLSGEPESRLEREITNNYKVKADAQLTKYTSVPNASTLPDGQPVLVNVSGNWYIYIRIGDKLFKTPAMTAA